MPVVAIDNLTKESSDAQIDAAISSCIRTERRHGHEAKQAAAMCYDMAREKTGKELAPKKG